MQRTRAVKQAPEPGPSESRAHRAAAGRRRSLVRDARRDPARPDAAGSCESSSHGRTSRRRSSRTPGWPCCAASPRSKVARRSRPGSSTSCRIAPARGPRAKAGSCPSPTWWGPETIRQRPNLEGRFTQDGRWNEPPPPWQVGTPEGLVLRGEAMRQLETALEALPPAQRTVVTLRDVEGWRTPRTSVTFSTSARPINGYSCTAPARAFAASWERCSAAEACHAGTAAR